MNLYICSNYGKLLGGIGECTSFLMSNYKILFFLEKLQDELIENIEISTAYLDCLWPFLIDFLQYSLKISKPL